MLKKYLFQILFTLKKFLIYLIIIKMDNVHCPIYNIYYIIIYIKLYVQN